VGDYSRSVVYFAAYCNLYKISLDTQQIIQSIPIQMRTFIPMLGLLSNDNKTLMIISDQTSGGVANVDLDSFILAKSINYTYGYWCGVGDSDTNSAILFTWNDILVLDFQTLEILSNVSLTTVTGGETLQFAMWDPTFSYILVGSEFGILQIEPTTLKSTSYLATWSYATIASGPSFAYITSDVIYFVMTTINGTSLFAVDSNKKTLLQPALPITGGASISPNYLIDSKNNILYVFQNTINVNNSTLTSYYLNCSSNTSTQQCINLLETYEMKATVTITYQFECILDPEKRIGYFALASQYPNSGESELWVQSNVAVVELM